MAYKRNQLCMNVEVQEETNNDYSCLKISCTAEPVCEPDRKARKTPGGLFMFATHEIYSL